MGRMIQISPPFNVLEIMQLAGPGSRVFAVERDDGGLLLYPPGPDGEAFLPEEFREKLQVTSRDFIVDARTGAEVRGGLSRSCTGEKQWGGMKSA